MIDQQSLDWDKYSYENEFLKKKEIKEYYSFLFNVIFRTPFAPLEP